MVYNLSDKLFVLHSLKKKQICSTHIIVCITVLLDPYGCKMQLN